MKMRGRRHRDGEGDVRASHLCARASASRRADLGRARTSPPRSARPTTRSRTAAGPSPIRLRARNACSRPRAAGVTPIDTIHADFRDLEGLERDCRRSRRDGFLGRMAIHPDQVATINRCYTPSEAEIAHARRIVEAFAANPGAGTLGLDGKMIDIPHLKAAQKTLASI